VRYKAIVFDFDGTLVESNQIKIDGFAHVFADHPACVSAVPRVMSDLKAGTRYEIVRALVGCIEELEAERHEAEAARRVADYSEWIEEQIYEKSKLSPAGALLGEWQRAADLYVCSLTPIEHLHRLLDRIGWRRYFAGVEGYPVDKTAMLRQTADAHGGRPAEILMVGDGDGDEAAARAAHTGFFRIRTLNDLFALEEHLKT
jgi:phosphoglycolate phosphatase-like HAD superfamily hydrolase